MEYCCDKFKEEYSEYDEGIIYKKIYEDGKIEEGYIFDFEGCEASGRLIYCPYCGTKLPDYKISKNK